jgi:HEAT repeat protein
VWLRANVPEVTSKTVEDATAKLLEQAAKDQRRVPRVRAGERDKQGEEEDAKPLAHPMLEALAKAPELTGIEFRGAAECRIKREQAETMSRVALLLRRTMERRVTSSKDYPYRDTVANRYKGAWRPDAVSTLVQVLQPEREEVRYGLTCALKEIKAPEATTALAQRAIFDLSPDVREEAIEALKGRERSEYRTALLRGLRHPWHTAALHAAEALVALRDRDALPELAALLAEPDPCQPVKNEHGQWAARQLVRVNHLRNCMMCHAESQSANDPLRGRIPVPGEPIPKGEVYYGGVGGFVRADVVYLKQDFSVMQPVPDHGKWPEQQRFDYVVRDKVLSEAELKALPRKPDGVYPQREAVLFALRALTGLDCGTSASDWEATLLEHGFLPGKK